MSDAEWYEIPGYGEFPNIEAARMEALAAAEVRKDQIEIYQCTRTLVRTFQRTVTVQETDVTATP